VEEILSLSAELDITEILRQTTRGDRGAVDRLFPLVYDELKNLAQGYLNRERTGHTLRPTALVHEAYLRLVDQTRLEWKDRAHFFAVAARAMRRILIDHARRRLRRKRGGGITPVTLDQAFAVRDSGKQGSTSLLALEEALLKLEEEDPEKARVVELRFFSGMTVEETAEVLGVTPRTIWRHWKYAQAYLYRLMTVA
jgi:RNA polymerase sigma factor (TIGR02999 family)